MAMSASATLAKEISDVELVARATRGFEGSFEELVRRYQRPISAYVYRMIGDYEAALDLTQEIFIKVYASLNRYRSEFKFSTWIYKIAHNCAVDHLRRNTGRNTGRTQSLTSRSEGEPYELPIESSNLTPEQESERKERKSEIESVVRSLPSAYRELIILRHSQDLTYEEIVEVTGLPLGTVKNRLFRAREMMRHQFVGRGITGV